ncbi:putative sugar nucleotidyl transferase [Stratiformator vulcanicus]|uniref:Bifunctional protein GlmU n=1 Tax=Stratiformator vulcanicus TaxID=2527980 RepID=A0A517R1R9_9PLAN|nr:putative sugar nucleotidyl transferase [Stratiformator vulcanicus]QDT37818.1 hypothetical protein Pan189_22000 [Stratiformator vulcanicus]
MKIQFFEDSAVRGLHPLILLRPAFDLMCGAATLRSRLTTPQKPFGAKIRPELQESFFVEGLGQSWGGQEYWDNGPTTYVNARWIPDAPADAEMDENSALYIDDIPVCFKIDSPKLIFNDFENIADAVIPLARKCKRMDASGVLLEYPWDIIDRNARQIELDFEHGVGQSDKLMSLGSTRNFEVIGSLDQLRLAATAQINPYVVFDTTDGPITVADGAVIDSFTKIEGPAYIGREARLYRALIHGGTTIGPVCRVGGEIEAAVFHGYANKYHEGFFGHGYVCPWVNLGALTTNSDLRNDYGNVRVPLEGHSIDSGQKKVGTFIADHSKTALCSLFNTGTSVGAMSLVVPGAGLLPKHIPSFSRVWNGKVDDGLDLDAAIETARIAMSRRGVELLPASEELLRTVHEQTRPERQRAIDRASR